MENRSLGAQLVSAVPLILFLKWLADSPLWGTEHVPWLLAALALMTLELGVVIDELMEKETTPYNAPDLWFTRLVFATGRIGTVIYLAVAVIQANKPYFTMMQKSIAAMNLAESIVWVPLGLWAILLAHSLYALSMGLRYGRSPRVPGKIISATLWLVGAAALWVFQVFLPVKNTVLSPNSTAAVNFALQGLYLGIILRHAVKLAALLSGGGPTARGRVEQDIDDGRIPWITDDDPRRR